MHVWDSLMTFVWREAYLDDCSRGQIHYVTCLPIFPSAMYFIFFVSFQLSFFHNFASIISYQRRFLSFWPGQGRDLVKSFLYMCLSDRRYEAFRENHWKTLTKKIFVIGIYYSYFPIAVNFWSLTYFISRYLYMIRWGHYNY